MKTTNADAALATQALPVSAGELQGLPRAAGDANGSIEKLLSDMLDMTYRRPLLQILRTRNVAPDVAQDLIKIACCQVGQEICARQLESRENVQEQLYRLACALALSYWQAEARRESALL